MVRKVLLTKDIDSRLERLTDLVEEVNGILFYRQQGYLCPIEAMFMTGAGHEGHVQSEPERIEVTNDFLRRNTEYQLVKFHMHSKGTISKYGEYYARHFSDRDIEVIKEQLSHDINFMAMLVTPEVKLLSGLDNPELIIVDTFPGYKTRSRAVSQALKTIATNLGYDTSRLYAHI